MHFTTTNKPVSRPEEDDDDTIDTERPKALCLPGVRGLKEGVNNWVCRLSSSQDINSDNYGGPEGQSSGSSLR